MKAWILALALLLVPSAAFTQTVSSISTTVSIVGTGFAAGDTVTASPSNTACTNVNVVSSTSITASCPNGTTMVTVKKKAVTYPFVLLASDSNGNSLTSMSFSWIVGNPNPAAQVISVFDSSPCPPVPPVPLCAWPNTTVTSDSPWLKVSPASGTTEFSVTVSVNTSGITTGQTGHITITQPQFTTPTLVIPVSLVVTGHQVNLAWNASASKNVTGYQVLRSKTSGTGYTQIGSTSALTYTDASVSPGTYYYVVTAVAPACPASPTCGVSAYSNQVAPVVP